MKIAYLITVYNNPKHLHKLIHALNNDSVDFFVHIDKKSTINFNLPKYKNLYVLSNNIKVYWGSYTFIEAVLRMILKAKSNDKYDYFVLISGSDYPIRSNKYIFKFLEKNKGKEFINLCKMPNNDKTFDRIEYFYISTIDRNNHFTNRIKRVINIAIKKLNIKRSYPKKYRGLKLYGGSNWWALSNSCINYILKFIKDNPKYVKFYKNTYIPEEMFFHTIIGNSKFINKVTNAITYTDWSPKTCPLPATINKSHLPLLSKTIQPTDYGNGKMYALFTRKFSDNSEDVLNKIDQTIRSVK